MLSEKWQKQNYERTGNDPTPWRGSAEDLLHAAQVLYIRYPSLKCVKAGTARSPSIKALQVLGVVRMLMAMALECLFKGAWINAGRTLVRNGVYEKIPHTNDHDLESLADKISKATRLNFTPAEREMLSRLSLWIVAGRYPIQRNWEVTKIRRLRTGGQGPPTFWRFRTDDDLFDAVLTKLTNELTPASRIKRKTRMNP